MIKSKKQLILSIALLAIVVLLNIPYPHSLTIGASHIIMNNPIKYSDEINYLGWGYVFSRNDVTFTVEFIEDDPFGDGLMTVSLLNAEKPLDVTIEGRHRMPIFITEEIDLLI